MEQLENKVEQVAHVGTHMTSRLWMPAVRHHRTTQPCCLDALSVGRDRLRRCYTLQHHDEGAEMPRKSSRKMLKSITGGASLNTKLLSLPGIKHVRLMGGCSKIVRPIKTESHEIPFHNDLPYAATQRGVKMESSSSSRQVLASQRPAHFPRAPGWPGRKKCISRVD